MSADGFVLSAPSLFSAPCKKVIATKIPILIQNILSLNIPRPKEAHRSLTRISFTTYSITAVTIHETSEVCFCPVYSDLKDKLLHSLLISPIGQLVASEATDHLSSISSRNFQSMKEDEKLGGEGGRGEWNQGDWIFRQISLPPHSFLTFPFL